MADGAIVVVAAGTKVAEVVRVHRVSPGNTNWDYDPRRNKLLTVVCLRTRVHL